MQCLLKPLRSVAGPIVCLGGCSVESFSFSQQNFIFHADEETSVLTLTRGKCYCRQITSIYRQSSFNYAGESMRLYLACLIFKSISIRSVLKSYSLTKTFFKGNSYFFFNKRLGLR